MTKVTPARGMKGKFSAWSNPTGTYWHHHGYFNTTSEAQVYLKNK